MRLLEIENLVATYGPITALHGVSIHVDEGELVSLVGANGAGKSTLLKAILGLVHIREGSIRFKGSELRGLPYYEIIRQRIAIVPEGRNIFAGQSVEENLELGAFAREKDKALDKKIMSRVYEYFPRLYERRRQLGGTLSGGEQQMLAVGRALMADPVFLVLDEPSMGLAPLIVKQVFDIINEIKKTGVTMLLIEQNATKALKISDRVYVTRTGEIVAEDTAENILNNDTLLNAYLR